MNLRDKLLAALGELPGRREFHLHVLVSAPRKTQELFPYATTHHRIYVQDILVLVSERPLGDREEQASDAVTSSSLPGSSSHADTTGNAPTKRVLVTAIEATLYNIPATSSSLFYISKVDSTGQGARPSPTPSLVRALLKFHIDPTTRPFYTRNLWVHLFARAQGQYLFPNSSMHPRKRAMSDRRLCAWWKRVLHDVVKEVVGGGGGGAGAGMEECRCGMWYLLPGFDEMEAKQALGESFASTSSGQDAFGRPVPQWAYGHPYSQTDIPLPYVGVAAGKDPAKFNLGQFIPFFDDDPKSRFLDEIACTSQVDGVKSPRKKRPRTNSSKSINRDEDGSADKTKEKERDEKPHGELSIVKPDDFWERMSFRQECVAGAVTGFFVVAFSWPISTGGRDVTTYPNPLAPQPGQVSHNMNKRLMSSLLTAHEFSTTEYALRATEILEGAIRGLCEGLETVPVLAAVKSTPVYPPPVTSDAATPEATLPSLLAPPRTPPRRLAQLPRLEDISPNPFPEPEASLETYASYIYGSVVVEKHLTCATGAQAMATTDGLTRDDGKRDDDGIAPAVTVLTVRRKRKDKR